MYCINICMYIYIYICNCIYIYIYIWTAWAATTRKRAPSAKM